MRGTVASWMRDVKVADFNPEMKVSREAYTAQNGRG